MLKQAKRLEIIFPLLLENVFPVFLVKSTLVMYCRSIARLPISMMPGFTITKYKIKRVIF